MNTDRLTNLWVNDQELVEEREDADVHDIVLEDDDDFVETVDEIVEDIRGEDVVTNHFRV